MSIRTAAQSRAVRRQPNPEALPDQRQVSDMPPLHACYFITIATSCRFKSLGRLAEGAVHLSPLGHEVASAWARIGLLRPWVSSGPFVVMPDHVHGLIWWDETPTNRPTALPNVVGGFKGDATRAVRRAGLLRGNVMLWQDGYSVRDIRTQAAFERASKYIVDNPAAAWAKMVGASAAPASPPVDAGGSAQHAAIRDWPASPPADAGGSAGHG